MSSALDREQAALQRRLAELLKRPENLTCAECSSRLPRWASTSLGVFFCTSCSGSHRGLGVHISKVKSTTLDKWTEAQVDHMARVGNARANAYWEALVQPGRKPQPTSTRDQCERYIRDKYERRMFLDTSMRGPEEDASGAASATAATKGHPPPATAQQQPQQRPQQGGMFDLLSLNEPTPAATNGTNGLGSAFGVEWTDFGSAQTTLTPATPPPAAPASALDQWGDFTSAAAPVPAQAVAEAAPAPIADDGWGDFAAAPATQATPPPAAEPLKKRDLSKNDILDLFNAPAAAPAQPAMPIGGIATMPGMMMGGLDQLRGGMPMGGAPGGYPQQVPPQQTQPQQAMPQGMMMQQQPMYQGYGYQQPPMMMQQQYNTQQFGYMQPPPQQQQYGMPQMAAPMPNAYGQFAPAPQSPYGAQTPPPKSPTDTQNIPEFKW